MIYIYRISEDGIEKIDAIDLGPDIPASAASAASAAYDHIRDRYLPTSLEGGDTYFATSAVNGLVLGYWKVSVQKTLTLASV